MASSSTAGHVICCRAAVAWEAGKPLVIEQVEVAPPKAMEVRIKIKYTSVCHTDVYFWEAKDRREHRRRCDRPSSGRPCASCVHRRMQGVPHCKSEESNMCDILRINTERGVMLSDGKTRFSKDGTPIYHFLGTSTFSEYTVIHSGCVAKIDSSLHLLTRSGSRNVAKLKRGSSVAVYGLGAVDLEAAEGARIAGASRIIGVDINPNRFEEAKKFGINEFINPKDHDEPVQEVIVEMTDGGVDRSVECTGNINAMISAFECVRDGWGVAVLVGVPSKDAAFVTKPINFLDERTLKGTFFGNYKPRTDLPAVVDMYMKKELEVEKFITHRIPFSEINKAFDYMLSGESLRCIICMDE